MRTGMIALGRPIPIAGWRPAAISPYGQPSPARPALGQAASGDILDNRYVSLVVNSGAATIGVVAGLRFSGAWSTVGWVVAVTATLRALNDLTHLK